MIKAMEVSWDNKGSRCHINNNINSSIIVSYSVASRSLLFSTKSSLFSPREQKKYPNLDSICFSKKTLLKKLYKSSETN